MFRGYSSCSRSHRFGGAPALPAVWWRTTRSYYARRSGSRERGSRMQGMPTLPLKSQNAFTQCLTLQSQAGQVLWCFTGGPDPCRWRHWEDFKKKAGLSLASKDERNQINCKSKQEEERNNDAGRQVGVSVVDGERRP